MRVAVFGSNSFIGSDLIDLILSSPKNEALGFSRSPEKPPEFLAYAPLPRERFMFVRADLNEGPSRALATLDAFEPDFIVNLSAQGDDATSWVHPGDFFRTNCIALAALIDALKDRPYLRRFLQISSSSVYANATEPIGEDAPLGPLSPYGVSKAAADMLLSAYARSYEGLNVTVVRPPNVYGPHQSLYRIIPKTVLAIRKGERVDLHGGGLAEREYVHARDLSRAIVALLEHDVSGIYNVSPDASVRIRDLVSAVCEIAGVDFASATRTVEDRRAQQSGQRLNSSRLRLDVAWKPTIDLRSGIRTVYEWIERDWTALANAGEAYVHQA